jgi:hypothetical protein
MQKVQGPFVKISYTVSKKIIGLFLQDIALILYSYDSYLRFLIHKRNSQVEKGHPMIWRSTCISAQWGIWTKWGVRRYKFGPNEVSFGLKNAHVWANDCKFTFGSNLIASFEPIIKKRYNSDLLHSFISHFIIMFQDCIDNYTTTVVRFDLYWTYLYDISPFFNEALIILNGNPHTRCTSLLYLPKLILYFILPSNIKNI